MWLTSATGTGSASLTWDASSSNEVLLVAAVGEDATTPVLTLSWPREVTTPWMWPGIVLGVLLVLAGAVYGFVTLRSRGRGARVSATSGRRSLRQAGSTDASATDAGAPGGATGSDGSATPSHDTSSTDATASTPSKSMTRRGMREQAVRDEAARVEAAEVAARRTKRVWPWTGAIPMVKSTTGATPAVTPAAEAVVDPARPVWLAEGTASTSGSSWRQAWGVRTETETDTDTDAPQDAQGPPDPAPASVPATVPAIAPATALPTALPTTSAEELTTELATSDGAPAHDDTMTEGQGH